MRLQSRWCSSFRPLKMYRRSDYVAIAQSYDKQATKYSPASIHVAFLYGRGGALLAAATNRYGTRSSGAGYSEYTIHAERAVLKDVGDIGLLRGATLVVIRFTRHGELRDSQPCCECRVHLEKAIRCYGLRRVYYS